MSDPTHTLEQRHYTLTLSVPGGSADPLPNLTRAIDEVAVALDEYVMDEDISADIDIEFTAEDALVPNIKVSRNGYTLSVTLGGPVSASQILSEIASDLVNMYDEMDIDYTDDLYDFQVYFGIGPAMSTSTEQKKSPKKPKRAKRQEEEEVMESLFSSTDAEPEVDVEEAMSEPEGILEEPTPEVEETILEIDDLLSEVEETEDGDVDESRFFPYPEIMTAIRDNPQLKTALGLKNVILDDEFLASAAVILTNAATSNRIKRVYDTLVKDAQSSRTEPSVGELYLLYFMVACSNISRKEGDKIEIHLYSDSERYDPALMRAFGSVLRGTVHSTVVPGIPTLSLKALVVLDSQPDLHSIGLNEAVALEHIEEVESRFVDGFFACLDDQERDGLLALVRFLDTRPDLTAALEINGLWADMSERLKTILLVMSANESRIKRLHKALAKVCKEEDRAVSDQEIDLLTNVYAIYKISTTPSKPMSFGDKISAGTPFKESEMESSSGNRGTVEATLLRGIPQFKLKPLVRLQR